MVDSDQEVSQEVIQDFETVELGRDQLFLTRTMDELYPHVAVGEEMTPAEMREYLVQEWVLADNELAKAKDKERKLREVVVTLAHAKEKGTTVLLAGDYEVKVSRSLEGKYPKVGDVSPAQELFAKYPQLREAFRVSFEERYSVMEAILEEWRQREQTGHLTVDELVGLRYLRDHRKVTSSSPQVKASKRGDN